MNDKIRRVCEIGARRKRLKADLADADRELRELLPVARAGMTHEEIRSATGMSLPSIRIYTRDA